MSMTQEAKALYYRMVFRRGKHLEPGLYRFGILRRWHWVAKNERAYLLSKVSNEHLVNINRALKERHPEENRDPIKEELFKRLSAGLLRMPR